ncbi:proteasome stabiliser-domain-containing protein [Sordaria sp. MPI-SDFR-AT-0083]|nr:proteasome stabiliser-domain-containing protein [Sordaria sp. MPI-SDFR-AT-0083]
MAAPTEQRELELVEKLDFRILAVANNEEKLQELLDRYLPALLLKAGSEHASVRNKVVVVCQRLTTFIESPSIILPVTALLEQYKATGSQLVKYFDLLFIQHSLARVGVVVRRYLIRKILPGIGSDVSPSRASLFNVFLRCLRDFNLPPRGSNEDGKLREQIGLQDPRDANFVAEWLGKLLLLRINAQGAMTSPGLAQRDVSFLTLDKPETWSLADLSESRIKVVNLLASGAFTDQERFLPAIYAASSSDFRLAGVGDDMLKRNKVSLEDTDIVRQLFEAHSRLPAPYRIRILGLLSKSEIATTFTDEILAAFRLDVAATGPDAMQVDGLPTLSSGLELTKVHRALFEFINWVARIGANKPEFSQIRSLLVSLLREFVEAQGWPKPERQSHDDNTLRSRAYETIGVLAKGTAMSDTERMVLARWLFQSLCEDPTADVVVNIDAALSSLAANFRPPHNPDLSKQLHALILKSMAKTEEGNIVRSSRHAATKWANQCLPFSDIYARWVDILAVAGRRDERSDVVEEGQKGLNPWTYYANEERPTKLPVWHEMVVAFFTKTISYDGNPDAGMDIDEGSSFRNFPGQCIRAFPVAVDYCKRILFLTALQDFTIEPGWERQLSATVHSDLKTRRAIRHHLTSSEQGLAVSYLLRSAFDGMLLEDTEIAEGCGRCFVELASFTPSRILAPLVPRAMELLPLVTSNKREIRPLACSAFGILAAHPANSQESVKKSMSTLAEIAGNRKTAVGSELNAVEGAWNALAHLISRSVYYSTDKESNVSSGLGDWFPTLGQVCFNTLSTQEALIEAYSQLWTAGVCVLPEADEDDIIRAFVDPLVLLAKKGNEKAITALGRLVMSLPSRKASSNDDESCDLVAVILERLFALYELRQAEVHFTVGEAIVAAIACWDSDVVQLTLNVEVSGDSYRIPKRPSRVTAVLEKLLTDCKNTKPSLLKASGIWLFCLIQYCSHLEEVQSRLRECQVAFMRLLSARDELVQETASRGLSLVYEKGDAALKGDLVRDLVASFTGSGPQLKVDEETELFDAGALPTGDGKSVTSYKDIVSLANEVGDQSLVYKLMSMATNAATWSTRSAFGRFGLSNILSESEVDPKLYPKLYRYRFDPNPNVQKSMNDIWKALVKDSNAVIDTHFDAIMKDLLKCILGKEWRVREASCAAIIELVGGRPFQKYEQYYKDIWIAALKVLDDVKGTVRNAALHMCIALSTTLVRQLEESGNTASARAMMNEALPFLLSDKGIESGVKEVKLFSTDTVIKICKKGGKALNPYIPTIVTNLLGSLTTLESDVVNYYYQRLGEDDRDKIDKLRSAEVAQSPITEAIENSLRTVDAEVMVELAPALEEAVKSAIGMPTRIGCSRVLSILATRHTANFTPYSARFLQLMEKQVLDRNDQVSQEYARAAAYIIRGCSDDVKLRFSDKLLRLYLESEDEARRQKVADVVLALSKISPDHFNALEGKLLPFSYLGKHDTDEYVRKAFHEVWDKHAGSSLSVSRYVSEIAELVQLSLDTAQWSLKHAGALAISSAVAGITKASDVTGQVNVENLKTLWPVYDKALALKTFPGKEKLLEPFPDFVSKSKAIWQEDASFGERLKKIAVREAKRNNNAYRPHAFRCLWKFAAARDDLTMLPTITEIVTPHLDMSNDEDAMDLDDKANINDRARGLDLKSQTAWAGMEAIAKGYNRAKMQEDAMGQLRDIALALEENAKKPDFKRPYISHASFDAIRRAFWYGCLVELLEEAFNAVHKGGAGSIADTLEVLPFYFATLDLDRADTGTEDQRLLRAKATMAAMVLAKLPKDHATAGDASGIALPMEIKKKVEKALNEERSTEVHGKWTTCLVLLDSA